MTILILTIGGQVMTVATGNVLESDDDAQPTNFEPGRQLASFLIISTQMVIIALDGIQDSFKTGTVPVPYDLAAQDVQLVQIALAL